LDEHDLSGEVLPRETAPIEVLHAESRKRPDSRALRGGRLCACLLLLTGEEKVDHARQVRPESLVRARALERRIPPALLLLALAVEAEVVRGGDEDVVDEDRRIAGHTEPLRELRVAVVLGDEARLAAVSLDHAASQ